MGVVRAIDWLLVELAVLAVSAWHFLLSPFFGCRCRFYPSCSQYANAALRERGFLPGLVLAAKRVLRCSALNPGGVDPVGRKHG